MKRLIYCITVFVWLITPLAAQTNTKKIESVKVAYITQRLELTPDESQKFWPLYNTYRQEMHRLITTKRSQRKALREDSPPVDELKIDTEILELRKRYKVEFSRVLPKHKVALFFQAEREFRQQLIQQLDKRQANN